MYSLDLQVWGILVLTCVTSERAAGSRKKDLVPGGVNLKEYGGFIWFNGYKGRNICLGSLGFC